MAKVKAAALYGTNRTLLVALASISSLIYSAEAVSQIDLSEYTEYQRGDLEVELSGLFMYDYDSFDGVYTTDDIEDSDSELRRARLGFEANYNDWRLNYSGGRNAQTSSYETANAYIRYSGFDFANITLGKSKEPFGMEKMSGSRYIATIERSMATDAFAPGRGVGLKLTRNADSYSFTTGLFEANEDQGAAKGSAWTTRLTAAPWQTDTGVLHLGAAASFRDLDGTRFDIDEPAEVHTAEDIVIGDNINNADRVDLFGLELAYAAGPFSIQSEYFYAEAESDTKEVNYSGSYVLGSYFLTGESRRYRNGEFGRVLQRDNRGAIELIARYSQLDAFFEDEGDKATVLTLGANYHINEYFKVMASYLNTTVSDEDASELDGEAFSVRAQFSF